MNVLAKCLSLALAMLVFSSMAFVTAGGETTCIHTEISVQIQINPQLDGADFDSPLLVFVHDMSITPSTRIVASKLDPSGIVEFTATVTTLADGSYAPSEYYVHIADACGTVAGGKMFILDPAVDTATPVQVQIDLCDVQPCPSNSTASSADVAVVEMTPLDADDTVYQYVYLKAGEVHSMSGVTVQWWIQENAPNKTILYFESFERSIVYNTYSIPPYLQGDTGWVSTGKKATGSLRTDSVYASGGSCYDVEVEVKLACEEWIIGPDIGDPYHMTYYFVEYPKSFTSIRLGNSITCNDANYGTYHCGANHPYYTSIWNGSVNSNPFDIGFATDTSDNTEWKINEVDLTFGLLYGPLEFDTTVHLIRAAGGTGGSPPKLTVYVNSGNFLYNWYHLQDDTRYIVHFSAN